MRFRVSVRQLSGQVFNCRVSDRCIVADLKRSTREHLRVKEHDQELAVGSCIMLDTKQLADYIEWFALDDTVDWWARKPLVFELDCTLVLKAKFCAHCEQPGAKRCFCLSVRYCSPDCQLAHWRIHRSSCSRPEL